MGLVSNNKMIIKYKGREYHIDKEKLKFVFNKLNIEIDVDNIDDIKNKFKKFDLFDSTFLENLDKIW